MTKPNDSTKNDGNQNEPQHQQVQVDDSNAETVYSNFCRVNGTPEELIIDFGMNKQPIGVPAEPLQVTQRVVMNYYTSKRFLAALQMAVQRHEATFGVIETDVQRRILPDVAKAAADKAK